MALCLQLQSNRRFWAGPCPGAKGHHDWCSCLQFYSKGRFWGRVLRRLQSAATLTLCLHLYSKRCFWGGPWPGAEGQGDWRSACSSAANDAAGAGLALAPKGSKIDAPLAALQQTKLLGRVTPRPSRAARLALCMQFAANGASGTGHAQAPKGSTSDAPPAVLQQRGLLGRVLPRRPRAARLALCLKFYSKRRICGGPLPMR